MGKIKSIYAKSINDSRGNATVEVELETEDGVKGVASVPSGVSVGSSEAQVVDVMAAIRNIHNDINFALHGQEITDQITIDKTMIELDGTPNKSRLGANAILAVSLAAAKAASKTLSLPLYRYIGRLLDGERSIKIPVPMFNVINGGQHANNNIDFQEFMAVPTGFKNFQERLEAGKNIFNSLRLVLEEKSLKTDVGDEGGYAPDLDTNEMAFGLMEEATSQAGFEAGKDVFLAIDVAAAYLPPTFQLTTEHYVDLINTYPIISIEDPLPSDDWHWWGQLKKAIDTSNKTSRPVYIVGDDIFMTHSDRLKRGITESVANAVLIKINQVGTLTETLDTIKLAKENNYTTIISHRAGETLDTFISDLAVGTGADFMKAGAPNEYHMERMCKYIRLAEIEKEISGN